LVKVWDAERKGEVPKRKEEGLEQKDFTRSNEGTFPRAAGTLI
jgi:hypothetical protein